MTNRPIQKRLADNQRLDCSVSRCTRKRYGAAPYCRSHREANRAHGSPLGHRIFPKEYASERKEVAAILRANAHHPGVQHATEFLDTWLADSVAGRPHFAPAELARLARHGVTGARILEEIAAVWMLAHRRRGALPDDARLTFALSTAVIHLAPRDVRRTYTYEGRVNRRYHTASKQARLAIGRHLRESLGLLLHRIALEPERVAAEKDAARAALFQPFTSKPQ